MKQYYLASLLCGLSSLTAFADKQPNVIVIFADDLGYGDLGCYGATKVKTPNIDELATNGKRFIDAHSASAVCTPSRYALITGQYPSKAQGGKGIWGPSAITSHLLIPQDTFTVADAFKLKNYKTACIGKWHLGFKNGTNDWLEPLSPGPNDLGFDYYFGMPVVNSAPPYVYVENDKLIGSVASDPLNYLGRNAVDSTPMPKLPHEAGQRSNNAFNGADKAHQLFIEEEIAPTFTEKAISWIEDNKENPFFLYLATTHIHHPFTPAPKFKGSSEIGLYGDFIQELDWMVGEIVTALEEKGLSDNTLIIFTSDNGGMFNAGGQIAFDKGHFQNGNLLGFKFGVWEGGHRVPFIAKWPGKIPPNTTSHQLVSNIDFLATFAAVIGEKLSPEQQKDSINILPALLGSPEKQIRDHLLIAPNKKQNLAIRKGKWMFIDAKGGGGWNRPRGHTFSGPPAIAHIGRENSDLKNGKIIKNTPPAQLYNLEADVTQKQNIYNENPEIVKEMRQLLNTYKKKK